VLLGKLPERVQVRDADNNCFPGTLSSDGLLAFTADGGVKLQLKLPLVRDARDQLCRLVLVRFVRIADGRLDLLGAKYYTIERAAVVYSGLNAARLSEVTADKKKAGLGSRNAGRGWVLKTLDERFEAATAQVKLVVAAFKFNGVFLKGAKSGRWALTTVRCADAENKPVIMHLRSSPENITIPLYADFLTTNKIEPRTGQSSSGLPPASPEFKFLETHGGRYGLYEYGPDSRLKLLVLPWPEAKFAAASLFAAPKRLQSSEDELPNAKKSAVASPEK
jgi:hypothetical protein